ncbi:MAG TPA: hypothetical protein VEP90_24670 [Methylomirabilota bacterium]|nr:hypothetical protein [Methylomirabilota bacterium]
MSEKWKIALDKLHENNRRTEEEKMGNLKRRNERYDWRNRHTIDYMELMRRNEKCRCCGKTPVQSDHIVGREWRRTEDGEKISHGEIETINDYFNGDIQFLCATCQASKRAGAVCRVHKKYLGIWNYLNKLDNIE